jgi:hypothetical protein
VTPHQTLFTKEVLMEPDEKECDEVVIEVIVDNPWFPTNEVDDEGDEDYNFWID